MHKKNEVFLKKVEAGGLMGGLCGVTCQFFSREAEAFYGALTQYCDGF